MTLYLISYDLMNHKTFGQYEKLMDELQISEARKILIAGWILKSSETAIQIRDRLRKLIHRDDRLLVTQISDTNWASWAVLTSINDLSN